MTTTLEPINESVDRDRADRSDARRDRLHIAIGVVVVVLLAVLVWTIYSTRSTATQAVNDSRTLAQQVLSACQGGGAAARELETMGACPAAATALAGAPLGEQSPPVQKVATDGQVRVAVANYLADNPPADGRTPSAAEVEAAVARVCDSIGCRGAEGQPGEQGPKGDNAPDVSDEQVSARVTAYCADNNGCRPSDVDIQAAVFAYCSANPSPCVGPQGERGEPGPLLPEYLETEGGFTRRCVLQPPVEAEEPPRYECTVEMP